jgi:hypothetical protein
MTIVPFLGDRVFGPQDIEAMSTALEDICKTLNLSDEAKSERELLAKKIIILAGQGERSAALLRHRMLREIACEPRGVGGWFAATASLQRVGRAPVQRRSSSAQTTKVIRSARRAMKGQDAEVWDAARLVGRLQWPQACDQRIAEE